MNGFCFILAAEFIYDIVFDYSFELLREFFLLDVVFEFVVELESRIAFV